MGIGRVGDGPEPTNGGADREEAHNSGVDRPGARESGELSDEAATMPPALDPLRRATAKTGGATYRGRAAAPTMTRQQSDVLRRIADCSSVAQLRAILGTGGEDEGATVNSLPESQRDPLIRAALDRAMTFPLATRRNAFEAVCDALRASTPRTRLPLLGPIARASNRLAADQALGYRYAMALVGDTAASPTLDAEELSTALQDVAAYRPVQPIVGSKALERADACDIALRDAIAHAPPACWGPLIDTMLNERTDMPDMLRRQTFEYFVTRMESADTPLGQCGGALEALAGNIAQCRFEEDIEQTDICIRHRLLGLLGPQTYACRDSVVVSLALDLERHRARYSPGMSEPKVLGLVGRLVGEVEPSHGGHVNPMALKYLTRWRSAFDTSDLAAFDADIIAFAYMPHYAPYRQSILADLADAQADDSRTHHGTPVTHSAPVDASRAAQSAAHDLAATQSADLSSAVSATEQAMLAEIGISTSPKRLHAAIGQPGHRKLSPLLDLPADAQARVLSAAARQIVAIHEPRRPQNARTKSERLKAFDHVYSALETAPYEVRLAVAPALAEASYALGADQTGAYERVLQIFLRMPVAAVDERLCVDRFTEVMSVAQTASGDTQSALNAAAFGTVMRFRPEQVGAPLDALLRSCARHPDPRVSAISLDMIVSAFTMEENLGPAGNRMNMLEAIASNVGMSPLGLDLALAEPSRDKLLELAELETPACRQSVHTGIALDFARQLPTVPRDDADAARFFARLLDRLDPRAGGRPNGALVAILAPCCAHIPRSEQAPRYAQLLDLARACRPERERAPAFEALIDALDTLDVHYDDKLELRQALREYIGQEPDAAVRERLLALVRR